MVQIEPIDQQHIDGTKPGKARHPVEDTPQPALLSGHAGQLSVGTVEEVGYHQQHHSQQIDEQSVQTVVVDAALHEAGGTAGADNHRPDGDGVGMHAEVGKALSHIISNRTDDVQVYPVFRLCRFQCCCDILVHDFFSLQLKKDVPILLAHPLLLVGMRRLERPTPTSRT